MGSALVYVLVVGVVAAVIYAATALLAGRGEELEPMPPGATPTRLPARDLTGADLRELRFQQSFRGYRMSEVDWALDRLAAEVDTLRARLAVHESLPPPAGEEPEALTDVAYPRPAVPEEDPTPTDPTAGVPSGSASTTKGTTHGHP
ncbi:DivIVA domain-containing protein [Actinomycetospora endophytica]|uniref:DivIVA domain-containing protein n=1 Tax=Actinomycetospora endophytica TaxID=2291215 RepID=UPI0027E35457|nr:DivIVA domain-containing protein [Actinomycetospora endophytica]